MHALYGSVGVGVAGGTTSPLEVQGPAETKPELLEAFLAGIAGCPKYANTKRQPRPTAATIWVATDHGNLPTTDSASKVYLYRTAVNYTQHLPYIWTTAL